MDGFSVLDDDAGQGSLDLCTSAVHTVQVRYLTCPVVACLQSGAFGLDAIQLD